MQNADVNKEINNMHKKSAGAVLERLKALLDENSDSGLARALQTTPQTLSSWKSRDSVPYAKCIEISELKNVSLDWLLTGQGDMRKGTNNASSTVLTPREQALVELFKELSDKDQREICQGAEEKKRLAELERQVQDLALKLERLNSAG